MPVSTVSIPVGQWFTSAEGTRWWFDSGSVRPRLRLHRRDGRQPRLGAAACPRRPHRRGSASGSPSQWASRGRATCSTRSRSARRSGAWPRPPRTASPLVRPTSTSSTCTRPPPTSRRRSWAARGRPAARCRPSARRSRRSRATRSTSSIPRTTDASARATAATARSSTSTRPARPRAAGARCSAAATAPRCARTGQAAARRGGAGGGLTRVRRGRPRRGARARPGTRRARSRIAHPPGSPARRARPRCPTRR